MEHIVLSKPARRIAYRRLADQLPHASGESRWALLMAAHVVGQIDLGLHMDIHVRMLRQALSEGDAAEAAGQVVRLLLAPIGHAASQLPAGNTGRATVSAFRAMDPPHEVQQWLHWALRTAG